MSRELPGYDSWLDNHGNPWLGGGDDNGEEWPFNEPVDMTQVSEDEYKIERVLGDDETLTIKIVEIDGARRMLIDDKLRNLGEHYIDYISLIDSFHEQFSGAIGAKFRVEPFEDEDENA
jgi:hypothetical protein